LISIETALARAGYRCDTAMQSHIEEWRLWYKGYCSSFHKYMVYNGNVYTEQRRASLKMAKRVCEDWAKLILNEKVVINVDNDTVNSIVKKVFDNNDFYVRAKRLIEKSFAFGSGAFVEFNSSDGSVVMDFVTADMIYPISWEGIKITECAFGSVKVYNGIPYIYLNIHTKDNYGKYIIHNRMFTKEDGKEVNLLEGVERIVQTNSKVPRFQIIGPNVTNNIEEHSPLGISVFANAIDEIKGVDLVYDSYLNEFKLGKKRLVVPISMTQRSMEDSGDTAPIFDSNDTVFYAIPGSTDSNDNKLQEINMELRNDAHKSALETHLGLLSGKCGLGTNKYKFENGTVKTATEVISENSDMFRNLKDHETVVKSALIGVVRAILDILKYSPDADISVQFDDSIIEDRNAEFTRRVQLVAQGAMAPWELRAYELGETEETAKKACAAMQEDIPEV